MLIALSEKNLSGATIHTFSQLFSPANTYSLASPCWLQHKHQKAVVTSFLIPYGLYLSLKGTFSGLYWGLSMYFLTCVFLIKPFLFRWGMFCSDAVSSQCCRLQSQFLHVPTLTVGDNKKTELTPPWAIHLLCCPAQHLQTLFPEQSLLPCVAVNQGSFLCWLQTELFSPRCPRQDLLPG